VLVSSAQALEIASQLTVSGWHNKLYSILLGGGKYKEFLSFSCDNRSGHNNNVLNLNLSWFLGLQGLTWTVFGIQTSLSLILFQYEECDIERMKLSRVFLYPIKLSIKSGD
jgi:hypothetical protein